MIPARRLLVRLGSLGTLGGLPGQSGPLGGRLEPFDFEENLGRDRFGGPGPERPDGVVLLVVAALARLRGLVLATLGGAVVAHPSDRFRVFTMIGSRSGTELVLPPGFEGDVFFLRFSAGFGLRLPTVTSDESWWHDLAMADPAVVPQGADLPSQVWGWWLPRADGDGTRALIRNPLEALLAQGTGHHMDQSSRASGRFGENQQDATRRWGRVDREAA